MNSYGLQGLHPKKKILQTLDVFIRMHFNKQSENSDTLFEFRRLEIAAGKALIQKKKVS